MRKSLVLIIVLTLLPVASGAATRTALVIGNGGYNSSPLANPQHDARDVARTLRGLGFDVILEIDADERQMKSAINTFSEKLRRSEIGLFFYAGHGMQIHGSNYLIPVGANIASESDVEFESVNAGRVLGKMREAGNRLNIVILDACRDNPFKRSFRTQAQGLAQMDAPKGTIIAYATSPGDVASDGQGRNSPFTKHLLTHLTRPDLTVNQVFNEAGQGVMQETGDRQIPWISSTPVARFYLAGGTTVVTRPQASQNGTLVVKSSPAGARITVDGKEKGAAPQTLESLPPGTYRVSASLDGQQAEAKTIQVNSGRTAMVTFYLDPVAPTKGRLYVKTDPADATVKIMNIGPQFADGMALDEGRYEVQVSRQGYEPKTEWVTIEPGKSLDLYVELDRESTPIVSAEPTNRSWIEPVTGMEFVWVPGGCFQMGCGSWAGECDDDEKPVHEVCIDGFWMGKYEVTQGQWQKVMGSNPSHFKNGDDWPVETVSWDDARRFIEELNARNNDQHQLLLPTEAQWEYAARSGGREEKYAGGSDIDRLAWYGSNSGNTTHRVGTKAPNGLGLYDMSGNVWEWCQDGYAKDAYRSHSRNNPVVTSGGSGRVGRGGSWGNVPRRVRSANRPWNDPGDRNFYLGFRLSAQ